MFTVISSSAGWLLQEDNEEVNLTIRVDSCVLESTHINGNCHSRSHPSS